MPPWTPCCLHHQLIFPSQPLRLRLTTAVCLVGFSDLVCCGLSLPDLWEHLETLYSFPSPKISIFFPTHASSEVSLGEDAESPGPGSHPSFTSTGTKILPGWPREKAQDTSPHVPAVACGPVPLWQQLANPHPPLLLRLSCPQRATGEEVCPLSRPWLHHTRTFRHQWKTARSVSIAPFLEPQGPHSPRPSVPFHLSGQCCFLKPTILPPLSPPLPPPLLVCSYPFSLSHRFPPPPCSPFPNPMKLSLKSKLILPPDKAVFATTGDF